MKSITALVGEIAYFCRELDGDGRAFGPHLPQGVQRLVEEARDKSAQANAITLAQRDAYVAAQIEKLALGKALKVQLAAGPKEVEGWLNIDFHPTQLAINVRWGLPLDDESVSVLYCSHMLEHFFFRFESHALLKEIHRVLQPGGTLRVVVPDIGKCMAAYCRKDKAFFEDRKKIWAWSVPCQTELEHFLEYAGANQYDVTFEGHKYGYDFPTLARSLEAAGFSKVLHSEYQRSVDPQLNLDDISPIASAQSSSGEH